MGLVQKEVIGVDIGGTKIKAGLIKNGTVLKTALTAVHRHNSKEHVLNDLFQLIDSLFIVSVGAIGIGVPAVVDVEAGIVYDVQNIPAWTQVALKKHIEQRYKVPVFINNDANCFALGEKWFGKARQYSNCIALSLGTGLGMGILVNGRLYSGVMCGAGEIGMVPYLDGIMEHYTGSFFFQKYYGQSAFSLYEKVLKNDLVALKAFEEYGSHLGEAIKIILYMYAPEAIILGGSIGNAFPFFERTLNNSLNSFAYQKQIEHLKIEKSDLVNSPLLGAAALCL